MKSLDLPRISKDFPAFDRFPASQQSAARRALLKTRKADVEARLVGEIGPAPDQDHVAVGALHMDMAPRILAGNPFALARGERDLAVDRQSELQRHARPAELEASQPAGERPPGLVAAESQLHLDTGSAQAADSLPRRARIGILQRH